MPRRLPAGHRLREPSGTASAQPLSWLQGRLSWLPSVGVGEAPDDETMTAAALAIAGEGNVRTTTLRAFNPDETRAIIAKVP